MTTAQYQPAALRTARQKTIRLNEDEFDQLHAAMGLCTEAAELQEAYTAGDAAHIKEEIGDMLWYIPLLCRGLRVNMDEAAGEFTVQGMRFASPDTITWLAAQVLNLQKRALAYENVAAKTVYFDMLRTLMKALACLAERYGFTLEEAASANIAKLRARYPGGFTNTDAVTRNLDVEKDALQS
jgi:NTP pyrophosphatase (non-canonical NTP hydrolase)